MNRQPNVPLFVLAALAMAVGWGFRGDYGHEAGAMVPGALLALAVCLTARRPDWRQRAALLAMLGALGWAFGGQMSYGLIIGYTASSSLPDVFYGYVCLFVIGALWGGIGAGVLSIGVTRPRSELERFAGPLVALWLTWLATEWSGLDGWLSGRWSLHDSDWTAATSALLVAVVYGLIRPEALAACRFIGLLALGWWAGLLLLAVLPGLWMTPPRSDNWAGCAGLFAALFVHLYRTRNRAGMLLALYGALAGGIGFAAGDLLNMLGRAQWGPIGRWDELQRLDYWKWMEQFFGLVMGFGVALGFDRVARENLAPSIDDETDGPMRYVALFFLLIVLWWANLRKNVEAWTHDGPFSEAAFGLAPGTWVFLMALLLSALIGWAIVRYRRGGGLPLIPADRFGRVQLLFVLVLWTAIIGDFARALPSMKSRGVLVVHLGFWLTAIACTWIVLTRSPGPDGATATTVTAESSRWMVGWRHWLLWILAPLLLAGLAWASVASHDAALPGSHLRWGETEKK